MTERHQRAIGTFSSRVDAERALEQLKSSGFPMDQVSLIAKNHDGDDVAGVEVKDKVGNKADEGAVKGAVTGGTLGGLTGLLVGLGALAIPGIGPIMLAGAEATALATTLAGGAIGAAAGSLVGALVGLGIPEDRARMYNDRVSQGHYLVIVRGTEEQIRRADTILNDRNIQDFGIYDVASAGHNDVVTNRTGVGAMPVNPVNDVHPAYEGHEVSTAPTKTIASTDDEPNVVIVDHRI
ncbi:MAG: hypothetical protein N5P05_001765 [Chroococcopsis gigantea SAG 12.99]|nr:hypothetical protein [Chroococcopsis gigantea SAG 12.99]